MTWGDDEHIEKLSDALVEELAAPAPWMQTFGGRAFDLMNPREEDVHVEDIAHSLARIGRFSGHTRGPVAYSVAQHSVLVSELVEMWGAPPELQLEALLHDAGEAYYSDLPSPVKVALNQHGGGAAWRALTTTVDTVVRRSFGLAPKQPELVHRADLVILACEVRDLMTKGEREWVLPEFADTRVETILPTVAQAAEKAFSKRFRHLRGEPAPEVFVP